MNDKGLRTMVDHDAVNAMALLGRYIREFREASRQLNSREIGGRWWKLHVSAQDAAGWSDRGYLPEEAAPLIAQGVTPQMAAAMGDLAVEIAGSPEEHTMEEIDRLVANGVLVDPRRVRIEQDPNDPDVYDVTILPEDQ